MSYRTDEESVLSVIPESNHDISRSCSSLDEWLWTIARHAVVKTDRAHVMIAARFSEKPSITGLLATIRCRRLRIML